MEYLLPDAIVEDAQDEYRIVRMVGRGARTVAYLAGCKSGELITTCILKEYNPGDSSDFEEGKARFIAAGKKQNEIREKNSLTNQTPAVRRIFEANGTAYIAVMSFSGMTMKELRDTTLLQLMELCRTIAKTVSYYHKNGLLCLDLKPENIYILQNDKDDLITQLVEFIDFDSIKDMENVRTGGISYTRDWAAPEQKNPYALSKISEGTDIYAIGEIIFYSVFGRHSEDSEHRGFSNFDFSKVKKEYRNELKRLDVCALLTTIFRNTLRSSVNNRFKLASELVEILDKLIDELRKKDYIMPNLPVVSPNFVGREGELKNIEDALSDNNVLFITGVGGIGKSTLVRNYIREKKSEYDVAIYLEYEQDIVSTFNDDLQLKISTCIRLSEEETEKYFERKLESLKTICQDKKVLFIIDNYSGRITKELSSILKLGFDTIIVSRQLPPKNSFNCLEVGPIENTDELYRLINLNLERSMTKAEQNSFSEIIGLVAGHTLVIELIARQIAAGNLDVASALKLIRANGFAGFSKEKISNFKDNEEIYGRLSFVVSALFDAGKMDSASIATLKVVALMDVRGMEKEFLDKIVRLDDSLLNKLAGEGWLYIDNRIHVHPVIAETVQAWTWPKEIDAIQVMEYHKRLIDIYTGMSDSKRILKIIDLANEFIGDNKNNYVNAMFYDFLAIYYDTVLGGANFPINEEEFDLFEKEIAAIEKSIEYMKQATESSAEDKMISYYLGLINIYVNAYPEKHNTAKKLLTEVKNILKKNGKKYIPNSCYYYMSSARYYSVAKKDLEKTISCQKMAADIADKVFKTDIELIDIIYIPSADNMFHHFENGLCIEKLNEAVELCKKYPDNRVYIDKHIELLRCILDSYMDEEDAENGRRVLSEIDRMNEKYKELGIYRAVDPEIRKKLKM